MKTSLNILRATSACVGGYGRQASFWTVRPKAKAIEYPIWMIGLTGQYDDLQWAINNSLIVDEADFTELKTRTFWPMFQYLFWLSVDAHFILKASEKKAGDFQRDALQEALKLTNAEEAQAWMNKYSRYKLNNSLFSQVANHNCWTDAQAYLQLLTEAVLKDKTDLCKEHEHFPFDLDTHVPGHDSRSKAPLVKRVRRSYDDDEPSSYRAKTKTKPRKEEVASYFDLPKNTNGRVVTKGEKFAHVCLNRDPWPVALQFLMDNNVPQIIGSKMQLSKVSAEGAEPEQFHATLNLFDARTIFTLMHLLQGQDFDLLKACHIEQKLGRLERTVGRYGDGNSMDALDEIVDNPDDRGDMREAQEYIVEEMQNATRSISEQGPTGGAIRERRAVTRSNGEEELVAETTDGSDDSEDEAEDNEY